LGRSAARLWAAGPSFGVFFGPVAVAPLPVSDPQFWIVTATALLAAAWIAYRLVPRRLLRGRRRRAGKHAPLTIDGKPVSAARRSGSDCH
jgi:peptidoglycan/LPS O-acetylase OafA/YrhL